MKGRSEGEGVRRKRQREEGEGEGGRGRVGEGEGGERNLPLISLILGSTKLDSNKSVTIFSDYFF